jgi:RecJ-like exonuclease
VLNLSSKCPTCKGYGKIVKEKMTCPKCLGIGKTAFTLGGNEEGESCEKCKGSGKIILREKCPTCGGKKTVQLCSNCKKIIKEQTTTGICKVCEEKKVPVVYCLKPPIDSQLVRKDMLLLSRVDAVKKVGVFVQIAPDLNVLIRTKDVTQDYAWDIGEEVIVRVNYINDKGKLFGIPENIDEYVKESLRGRVRKLQIKDLNQDMEGSFISIDAQVVSILQTSGPTRFTLVDPTSSINGAAFIKPGERAFPEIEEDAVVAVFGEINRHRDILQIEIRDMEVLDAADSSSLVKEIEKAIDKKAAPKKIEFSIKSELLEKLRPDLTKAAKRIRKAIYTGQPIIIRNHADADGTVAGFAVQRAIKGLMKKEGYDDDTIRIRLKRLPNKPPFFDAIDVTKDLDFALSDQERFGDKLPLFVCLDFGSSKESLFPYLQIKSLDLEIIVIDHHFPDKEIQELVDIHVNPYFIGGGYELSAGMLGFELARIIFPEVSEELLHLPAIAGLMDRVEGEELDQYIKLAETKDYSVDDLKQIGLAVDYEVYQLRFSEGQNLLNILFGVDTPVEWHTKMYNLVGRETKQMMEKAYKNALPHSKKTELENGVLLVTIDVELYTHRFTFPNPGKLTGLIFDHYCENNPSKAVVTLGEGPDFIILRSKGLVINFPDAVKLMQKKIPEADVEGGGHEVVGSFKFYEGVRKKVRKFFIDYLSKLELKNE